MKKVLFVALLLIGGFYASQTKAATYYIDQTSGSDANDGLASSTPWQNIYKYTDNARSAGDVAFVRRNTASTSITTLAVTSDGNLNNPIILSADYDEIWQTHVSSAQTYTVTFGSTTMASSASSTDIVAGQWVYVSGDMTTSSTNPSIYGKDWAYEVATVTPTSIIFYIPYKGPSSGAGKTLKIMPPAPQYGATTDANQAVNMSSDEYWIFKGFDMRSTHASGVFGGLASEIIIDDFIVQGNGASDVGFNSITYGSVIKKSRIFNVQSGNNGMDGTFQDGYINCNNVATSRGHLSNAKNARYLDTTIINCTNATFTNGADTNLLMRNITHNEVFSNITAQGWYNMLYFEDNQSIVGKNSTRDFKGDTSALATTTQKSTTALTLRSGGGNSNLLVIPPRGSTNVGISTKMFPFSFVKLFEYPVYTASNTQYTYTMYFNQASTTGTSDWTANPTASEFWIEAEYYKDTLDADRYLLKSTGTVDFVGTATATWKSLSVIATSTQDGIVYLRGWYGKPRETGKENSFFMDVKPVISSP